MTVQIAAPAALSPFMELMLGAPALQRQLGSILDPEQFCEEAMLLAQNHGLAVAREDLKQMLVPDPVGLGRFGPAPVTLDRWPGPGWLPTRSVPTAVAPAFDWAWFGERALIEPFYEDSVRRTATSPLNLLLRTRTGIEALVAEADGADSVPLGGLVFHMSRCGSTLLARMLGALRGNLVLSEPEPLDAVLLWAWREQVPVERAVPVVRAVVAALARRRGAGMERCFIKTDAWHILLLPLLRAAFPEVPWIYLFRDPVEVLVSHRRQPGMHTVAGVMPEELFGISRGQALDPLDYAAGTFEAIGRAALTGLAHGGGIAVPYPAIVPSATGSIAAHLGLSLDSTARETMTLAAGSDAKAPERAFTVDSQEKLASADDQVRAAGARLALIHAELVAAARRIY